MTQRPCLALVLAAGQGTRMKSRLPKVLHEIAGRPMLAHVLDAAAQCGIGHQAVVVAPGVEGVEAAAKRVSPATAIFIQEKQLGTAHAVLAARPAFETFAGDVIILYGDTPLITPQTIGRLRSHLGEAGAAVLGFTASDPSGYGRLIMHGGELFAIREHKDASEAEHAITFCNSGVMAFRAGVLLPLLQRIGNGNAKREHYLPDAVALARADGIPITALSCPETEVLGVNDRAQLARAEAVMQDRLRERAMANGATLIAPQTVTFSFDTRLGEDVIVEPNVFFGPKVTVERGAHIKAFCHIEGARIGPGAIIGPFARLRPGAAIGADARVGNFVEIKKASIEAGAKVNHLTYIGDARVGKGANVGAGTITCNYDGFSKHFTDIGANAFIGSNSALVAPVKIGDGAYVGSGSVVTKDVEDNALALSRAPQKHYPEWAARIRARRGRNGKEEPAGGGS